jgi:hypothetical protein
MLNGCDRLLEDDYIFDDDDGCGGDDCDDDHDAKTTTAAAAAAFGWPNANDIFRVAVSAVPVWWFVEFPVIAVIISMQFTHVLT